MVKIENVPYERDGKGARARKSKLTVEQFNRRLRKTKVSKARFAELLEMDYVAVAHCLASESPLSLQIEIVLEALEKIGKDRVWRLAAKKPMTGQQLRERIASIDGMTQRKLARVIGMNERTVRRMCEDDAAVKRWFSLVLRLIEINLTASIGADKVYPADYLTEERGWISAVAAAERVGVSKQTIFDWIKEENITVRKTLGRSQDGTSLRLKWKDVFAVAIERGWLRR